MAEESVTSLVTPQINNLSGRKSGKHSEGKTGHLSSDSSVSRYHRASLGSYSDGDSSGRNSSGIPNSPNNSQEVIPHYLRASTGSCHDFCKYGRKHTFEPKPWRPLSKRITKPPSDQLILGGSPVLLERKKVAVVKPASSHDTKTHSEELKPSPDTKTLARDPPEIIKREVSLPSKKVEVSSEQELATGKKMSKTERKSNNMSTKRSPLVEPKALVVKPSPSSDTSEGKTGRGRRNSNIKDGKTVVASKASLKKVLGKAPDASSSSRPSITETVNLKSRKNRNLKLVSPLKDQNRIQKATSVKPKNEKVPEKILHVVKTETVNSLVESIQNGDVTVTLPTPSKRSPKSVSHPHYSLSPHEEDQVEEEDEGEEEEEDGEGGEEDKIKLKNNGKSKLITKNNDAANLNENEFGEGNRSRTLKKGRAVVSKDKDSSALKLNFRRGKVVELQAENNTPRRLRFRRGRLLVGNQDGKADVRRNFKKKGIVDDKDRTNPSNGKVVLRHQDVQDKKDTQGLLNNVIEETASKLVESRKSKVKALVGAFETVISLQESKPSSQAVN